MPEPSRQRSRSPLATSFSREDNTLNEDEELDEFGRVKQRRSKFTNHKDNDDEESRSSRKRHKHRPDDHDGNDKGTHSRSKRYEDDGDEDGDYDTGRRRRHRHRYRSRSRSPFSQSDDNEDDENRHRRHRHRHDRRSTSARHSDADEDDDRYSVTSDHHHHGRYRRNRSSPSLSPRRHQHDHDRHRRHGSNEGEEDYNQKKIYIGDLAGVTSTELEQVFSKFGHIAHIKLIEGKEYGFITFEKSSSVQEAISAMNGTTVGLHKIRVNRAKTVDRSRHASGSSTWMDEDGAKMDKTSSTNYRTPHLPPSPNHPPIHRTLTSYDDLL